MIGAREAAAVSGAVRCGAVTHGPHVGNFERGLCAATGATHAVAVSSGTAALHLALLAAGIKPGDSVVVPAFTFVATANAVMYCGAIPNFVDCDDYGGIDPQRLDDWLSEHHADAVVCVHCFGHLCDMDGIVGVCEAHGIPLVEDSSQALGAIKSVRGLLATLSFNGNKIITTGGGGAVLTNDELLSERVRSLANVSKIDTPYSYWHSDVGFNYRMPNLNAVLGCVQLEILDEIIERKAHLAAAYDAALAECPEGAMMPRVRPTNNWLNAIKLTDGEMRQKIVQLLESVGLESRLSWVPLHLLPMYRGSPRDDLSNTMKLASTIVNVPSGPGIAA